MSTGWRRGPVCGVDNCPSRLWRTINGRTVCQYGHVNEYDIEYDDEDENMQAIGGTVTRRLTNVSGLTVQADRRRRAQNIAESNKVEAVYGKQLEELLLRAFQVVYAKQIKALRVEYGLDAGVFHRVAKKYWVKLLVLKGGKVGMSDLLRACYVSLLAVGAPVYLIDFVGLCSIEKVPCQRAESCLPPSIVRRIPYTSIHLLNYNSLHTLFSLEPLKELVDFEYHLNYLPLLVRYVVQDYLPLEIVTIVQRQWNDQDSNLDGDYHPELRLLALILSSSQLYFAVHPEMYGVWKDLYSSKPLLTDVDPIAAIGEMKNHGDLQHMLEWTPQAINEMIKVFYNYHLPAVKNDNVSRHKKQYTSQRMAAQRLNAIFPLKLQTNFDHNSERYQDHLLSFYKELYRGSRGRDGVESVETVALDADLVDFLADKFKCDTCLDYTALSGLFKSYNVH